MFIEIENTTLDYFYNKKVILFGAGSCGLHALEEFEKRNIKIEAFCDNNPTLVGNNFEGYKIISPEKLNEYPDINIIITSTFHDEIVEQLKNIGIQNVYVAKVGVLRKTIEKNKFYNKFLSKEESNKYIYDGLIGQDPFLVSRLGSVELETIAHYLYFLDRKTKVAKGNSYPSNVKNMMIINAGFFPPQETLLDKFCELYLKDIKEVDMLWSMWLSEYEDKIYRDYYKERPIAEYDDTYFPIEFKNPWLKALKNKKILVIHPFEQSILENYNNKDKFFVNKDFLPEFELKTLKAIQSIAGTQVSYSDWFEALESMENSIDKIDFDIALIGAGAYGLPLAAYIKKIGKKAVHVGGALQLYFGIRGKAWNKLGIYNEYWTYPLCTEKPDGYKKVEAGRYW